MLERIKAEPVVVTSVVSSLLALAVAFGLSLSDVQIAAVLAVTNSLLALFVRGKVSPISDTE